MNPLTTVSASRHLLDEAQLWKDFKNSSTEAFGRLYSQHYRPLMQYGKRLGTDATAVQDAIQDLFMDLWRMRENLADNVSVRFYLYRSLRRRLAKLPIYQLDTYYISPFSPSPESTLISQESIERQQKVLTQAISTLSQREREVLMLRFFQDHSVREVATKLLIKEQTVRNLMQRAFIKIRKQVPTSALY